MDSLDRYRKISESERESGCFTALTIQKHQKALRTEFMDEMRANFKKCTIYFIGSFLCVVAVFFGLHMAVGKSVALSLPILRFYFVIWTLAYAGSTFVIFAQYPTIKRAELDLQIMRAIIENHRFQA